MLSFYESMSKYLIKNTITSVLYQIVSIVCAFILPRLILSYYGSEVNGLLNSIASFLGVITYLEFGISAIVQSALYLPLYQKKTDGINKVMHSAQKFFNKIGYTLVVYVIVLCLLYPRFIANAFDSWFVIILVLCTSANLFAQYFWGITNQLLLYADQHGYIAYSTQIITVIVNTVLCAILIKSGFSIQLVKLTTATIFIIRPIVYSVYVKLHYQIAVPTNHDGEEITQKWNGIAQHLAAVLLGSFAPIVLTFFSSLSSVSIFAVYFMVIGGLNTLVNSLSGGIHPYIGNIYASGDFNKLYLSFQKIEYSINAFSLLLFGSSLILLRPFVLVYTQDITDTDYNVPVFAAILTLSYFFYSIRLPFHIMVQASNRYRDTQKYYLTSVILIVVGSIAGVLLFDINGVGIGSLIAMLYQYLALSYYSHNNILESSSKKTVALLMINVAILAMGYFVCNLYDREVNSYMSWFVYSIKVFFTWVAIIVPVYYILFQEVYKNNKKILLTIEGLGPGGAERQLCGLAKMLTKRGYECIVLTYTDNNFYNGLLQDCNIVHLYYPKLRNKYLRVCYLVFLIYKINPKVIISYLPSSNIACCLSKLFHRKKLIVSDRNNTVNVTKRETILFNLYRLANFIVPNSITQARFLKDNFVFLKRKIVPIINFVDLDRFSLSNEKVSTTMIKIIVAARYTDQKNCLAFLDVVNKIKENKLNVYVNWFGSKSYDPEYFETVKEKYIQLQLSGYMAINDVCQDIQKEYQNSDVFILPSLFEGYPNSLIEAMSCGLPVLCSNKYENPLIVEDGVNGFLFDPNNIDDIYEKILKIINMSFEDRLMMGKRNREKCILCNSENDFVEKYIELIEA